MNDSKRLVKNPSIIDSEKVFGKSCRWVKASGEFNSVTHRGVVLGHHRKGILCQLVRSSNNVVPNVTTVLSETQKAKTFLFHHHLPH